MQKQRDGTTVVAAVRDIAARVAATSATAAGVDAMRGAATRTATMRVAQGLPQ